MAGPEWCNVNTTSDLNTCPYSPESQQCPMNDHMRSNYEVAVVETVFDLFGDLNPLFYRPVSDRRMRDRRLRQDSAA